MTKFVVTVLLPCAIILLGFCKQPAFKKETKDATKTPQPHHIHQDTIPKIRIAERDLADKKDPACGMPAFRFLQDTAVVDKKMYGFCSKECKAIFLKNPAAYIKIKKPNK